jgi:hypothetical protein
MSGIDGTTYAVTLANDKLCIAGTDVRTFNDGLALPAGFASAWNGTSWSPLGSFVGGWGAVLGTSGTDIIVAGEVYIGGDAPSNIARWNGTLWQKIGPYSFWQTHAIAEHQGSLYAGGGPSLETLGRVARLNGSAWESVGGGVGTGSDSVSALASWNDLLVAGGSFGTAGGVPVANVASWNGSAWSPLGAGLDGVTLTFAALGADLVAGGTFTHAGGEPASGVARWDGAAWHAMGTRCVDIRDFAQVDGVLYAAGHFRDADDLVRQTVARWTGTEWDLMGSGVPQGYDILWVEGYHGDLYAGGDFRHAFGNVSAFITRLPAVNTVAVEDRAHAPLALAASPNPGRGGTTFAFTLPVRGHVRLAVFDAAGREVARVLDDDVLAGAHEARWTAAARPGVYFARLDAPGGASRVARVVRLD